MEQDFRKCECECGCDQRGHAGDNGWMCDDCGCYQTCDECGYGWSDGGGSRAMTRTGAPDIVVCPGECYERARARGYRDSGEMEEADPTEAAPTA